MYDTDFLTWLIYFIDNLVLLLVSVAVPNFVLVAFKIVDVFPVLSWSTICRTTIYLIEINITDALDWTYGNGQNLQVNQPGKFAWKKPRPPFLKGPCPPLSFLHPLLAPLFNYFQKLPLKIIWRVRLLESNIYVTHWVIAKIDFSVFWKVKPLFSWH